MRCVAASACREQLTGRHRLASAAAENSGAFKAVTQQGRVNVVACFPQGYNGRGCERFDNGQVFVGEYSGAKRHGRGTMQDADGRLQLSFWKKDRPFGEGAKWSADYSTVVRTHDGKEDDEISQKEGAKIAQRIGLPCPSGYDLSGEPEEPSRPPAGWASDSEAEDDFSA